MTHEGMEALIDSVNDGSVEDRVFLWNLGDGVAKAKVWLPGEKCNDFVWNGWDFFFVFVNDYCVAALQDFGESDYHAYVKEECRGKGLINRAITNVIFPYYRSQGRTKQRATFNNPDETRASIVVARARRSLEGIGFSIDEDKMEAMIELNKFAMREFPVPERRGLTESQCEVIRKRISDMWNYIVEARKFIKCTLKGECRKTGIHELAEIRANIRHAYRDQIRDANILDEIGCRFRNDGRLMHNCIASSALRDIADAGGEDAEAKALKISELLLLAFTCIAKTKNQLYEVYGANYSNRELDSDDGIYSRLDEISQSLIRVDAVVEDTIYELRRSERAELRRLHQTGRIDTIPAGG